MSPYAGMLNNPVSYVDPDGRNPIIIGMMLGSVAGFGIGYASGLRGNELLASTLGGMALGAGIGFGATGGFAGFGQGVGGVLASAPGAAANLAQRVFQGVGPTVGMDMATRAASSIIAGPFTQPGLLVDDYGLSHLDYGASYQPSQYAGMNIMQYHQAKTSDGFWNDPVTQGVIELATLPLPVPKLGMGKLFGRLAAKASTPTGKFYSVAYQMQLNAKSYSGVSRYLHFKEANIALSEAMKSNSMLNRLGISVPRSASGSIIGKSPSGWVWHHSTSKGVMQLVPKSQHPSIPGGIFWDTMHPGGIGGYSIWGNKSKNRTF